MVYFYFTDPALKKIKGRGMIFRIQESIFFRNDDGRVWTDDDNQVILTATTGRLLIYLLQHKGQVVSKDELLEKVWDAYGLSTSSNSLYKYISDLRAVFRNLGCTDEIIVTVPKLGFMIANSVLVEQVEDSEQPGTSDIMPVIEPDSDPIVLAPVIARGNESNSSEASITAQPTSSGGKITLLSIVLIILVAGIVAFYTIGDRGRQEETTWPLGNIDNCPVRSFNPHESEKSLAVLRNVIATKGILCSGHSTYFIQVSAPVLADKKGRIFISRCNYVDDKRTKFSSCENYYRADYEITR